MIKEYINRDFYLEKIKPFIDKDIIKVIVGQRRVGKSYFLFQIMDAIKCRSKKSSHGDIVQKPNIIYINKELHEFESIRTSSDLISFIKKKDVKQKKSYVFIDEVQDIGQFEKALRSLQAEGVYDIYCTGSNANLLSGELATYLSGRYVEIKMYGLSYVEFLVFHRLEDSQEALLKYIKYGGLPYLMHLSLEDPIVYDYLRNIYNAILFKDIIQRYHIRGTAFLEKLVEYLAGNVGSIVSAKKISDFLKSQRISISAKVVINYLSYLSSAFFVFKVSRFDIEGKKIFEINEKYYFEDLGLRHTIIGYRQTDINKILENLVFLQLKTFGYDVTVGKLKNKEIDFVCKRGSEQLYVQVAYLMVDQKVRDREFGNLLAIADNYPKMVVSMDEGAEGMYQGVKHVHIRNFLTMDRI